MGTRRWPRRGVVSDGRSRTHGGRSIVRKRDEHGTGEVHKMEVVTVASALGHWGNVSTNLIECMSKMYLVSLSTADFVSGEQDLLVGNMASP